MKIRQQTKRERFQQNCKYQMENAELQHTCTTSNSSGHPLAQIEIHSDWRHLIEKWIDSVKVLKSISFHQTVLSECWQANLVNFSFYQ